MEIAEEGLTRREREKLAHRKEIIDAAERVFSKKGFLNATLDEVAQEAEFSKGALYIYFTSKEDILYTIIKEKSFMFGDKMLETLAGKKSFKEELRDFFEVNAELAFSEKAFFALLMELWGANYKTLSLEKSEEFKANHQKFNDVIMNRVKKAMEDGELRDIMLETVCGLIHGVSHNMSVTLWDCEDVETLKMCANSFIDILFNGIAKEKEN